MFNRHFGDKGLTEKFFKSSGRFDLDKRSYLAPAQIRK